MGNEYSCCQTRNNLPKDKEVAAYSKRIPVTEEEYTRVKEGHLDRRGVSPPVTGANSGASSPRRREANVARATKEKIGIGAYFHPSPVDSSGLAVKALLTNGPSHACGKICIGDIIIQVDNHPVYGKRQAELAEDSLFDKLRAKALTKDCEGWQVLLGPHGTKVKLRFRSGATGQEYEVELVRGISK